MLVQEEGWIDGEIAFLGFNRMLLDYPALKLTSEMQQARKAELLTLGHTIQAQPLPCWVPDSSGIVDTYTKEARVSHTTIKQGPVVGTSNYCKPSILLYFSLRADHFIYSHRTINPPSNHYTFQTFIHRRRQ